MDEMSDDLVMRTRIQRAYVDALLARRIAEMILDMRHFGDANGASDAVQRAAVEQLLAANGWRISDLSVPQRTVEAKQLTSDARVLAMHLGLAPWPSTSGWIPGDIPFFEKVLTRDIVAGVASLACAGSTRRING